MESLGPICVLFIIRGHIDGGNLLKQVFKTTCIPGDKQLLHLIDSSVTVNR